MHAMQWLKWSFDTNPGGIPLNISLGHDECTCARYSLNVRLQCDDDTPIHAYQTFLLRPYLFKLMIAL